MNSSQPSPLSRRIKFGVVAILLLALFIMAGSLLSRALSSSFDKTQTTLVHELEQSLTRAIQQEQQNTFPEEELNQALDASLALYQHLGEESEAHPQSEEHYFQLLDTVEEIIADIEPYLGDPDAPRFPLEDIQETVSTLNQQSPSTSVKLNAIEIGTPLLLSLITLYLLKFPLSTKRYPKKWLGDHA